MLKRSAEVVYNSDLIISDPRELATLSIFYDRVFLPSTSEASAKLLVEFQRGVTDVNLNAFELQGYCRFGDDNVWRWERQHAALFEEGVFRRLPEADPEEFYHLVLHQTKCDDIVDTIIRYENAHVENTSGRQIVLIRQDQLRHLLRSDIQLPSVFVCQKPNSGREVLKAVMAREVVTYLLPAMPELPVDTILELRQRVRDIREGFAMHLQHLTREIDSSVEGGESIEAIRRHAQSLVETELIPDYREFRRQLLADVSGFWRKVLEVGLKVFEIDVAPWTPKFYGELLGALTGGVLTTAEARKASLTNRAQAYQFMSVIESADDL